jgi:aminocarboxymuconate-semialdehyde decarboxylase
MRVDIHAHCFPAVYLDALTAAGSRSAASVVAFAGGDSEAELGARLALMDAAGVDLEVLSPSSLLPIGADPAGALASATLLNDRYGEIVRRRPDRFAAFGVVPLDDIETALMGLDDALGRPGVVGLAAATSIDGESLADVRFEPLFVELDRRGALLFIHPAGAAAGSPLIEGIGLSWPLGAPIEDTISVTHLIARGIPSRFPNIRIVNAHLGGALPMLLQRLDNQFPRVAPEAPELPSVAVRRMWFDTVGHGHVPALVAARLSFGADRLVLGTDYPYVRGDHHQRAIDYLADAGLPAEDLAAIRDDNAAALIQRRGG